MHSTHTIVAQILCSGNEYGLICMLELEHTLGQAGEKACSESTFYVSNAVSRWTTQVVEGVIILVVVLVVLRLLRMCPDRHPISCLCPIQKA